MKASNYCFEFPLDNTKGSKVGHNVILAYNSMTNALAIVETIKWGEFKKFKTDETPIQDEEFKKQLFEGGFLIEEQYNELHELRHRLFGGRYNASSLGLTIAPTSDCNFRCTYCYEKQVLKEGYMSDEIMDAICAMVERRVEHIRSFSVTWYGGEPLLCVDKIKKMSERFITICKKQNVSYSAGIITNGFLLNEETIKTLTDCQVNFYQITIDGTRETHNKRRFLADGSGTYDTILENLTKYAKLLPDVAIRINVDKNNFQAADDISNIINQHALGDNIRPYLGRIINDNDDPELDVTCFTTREFAETDLAYSMRQKDKNYQQKYPYLKGNYCGVDNQSVFVIGCDGNIYKCWNEIGRKERSIGNVLDEHQIGNRVLYDNYMLFDPTQNEKCSKCKVLPICMGGCPYYRVNDRQDTQCSIYKQSLNRYITYVADRIMEEREQERLNTL